MKKSSFSREQPKVFSTVETRERLVQPFDDPLWWPKDAESIKTEFGRTTLAARRKETFNHGYCDQDHPLQVYINEIASHLPQLKDCRVIVVPYDVSSNAGVFPDGTIVITPKLIGRAKTKEALMGVLLHEWTHFHRKHAEIRTDQINRGVKSTDIKTSVLEGVSAGRLHEYIADIQGAVIELDKLGFNPLGYKEFLEDLVRREGSKGGGIVHGASQERVLNITELLATIHLPSTDKPLEQQDPRVMQWVQERAGTHRFAALRESMFRLKAEPAKELMERKLKEIEKLPLCLIPNALAVLWSDLTSARITEVEQKGGKAFHACFIPPIRAAGTRLAQQLLGADGARDPLAVSLAISGMYVPRTELPSQDTKRIWSYARGELEFFLFMQNGIPDFLSTAEEVVDLRGGMDKGLFMERTIDLDTTYQDWLVAKFPEPTLTADEIGTWWSMVRIMIKTDSRSAPKPTEDGDEAIEEYNQQINDKVKKLFLGWATKLLFPTTNRRIDAYGVSPDNARIQSLRGQLFHHPDAITVSKDEVADYKVDIVASKRQRRLLQAQKEVYGLTLTTQDDVDAAVRKMVEAILSMPTLREVDRGLDSVVDYGYEGDIAKLMGYLVYKEVLRTHLVLDGIPEEVIRLRLFDAAESRKLLELVGEYQSVIETVKSSVSDDDDDDEGYHKVITIEDVLLTTKIRLPALNRLIEGLTPIKEYESEIGNVQLADLELISRHVGSELLSICIVEALAKCPDLQSILDWLRSPIADRIIPFEWIKKTELGRLVDRITDAIASGEIETLSFGDRVELAALIRNAAIRSEYCDRLAIDSRFQLLSFSKQVEYAAGDDRGSERLVGSRLMKTLAEEKSFTKVEYRKGFTIFEKKIQHLEKEGLYSHGLAILLEQVVPSSTAADRLEFIRASILTKQGDGELRSIVLKEVSRQGKLFQMVSSPGTEGLDERFKEVRSLDASGDMERQAVIENNKKFGHEVVTVANTLVEELYRLQDASKHLLLRRLLGGANGLLQDVQTKGELLGMLRRIWIEKEDGSSLLKTIEEVEAAIVDDTEWEVLYLGLVGLLREQVFQRGDGSKRADWRHLPQLMNLEAELGVLIDTDAIEAWEKPPADAMERPWRYSEQWTQYAEARLWSVLNSSTQGQDRANVQEQRTPLGFVKEIVAHSSAIGVRSLQNIGQVTELSPQEERDLSDVYDQVEGQSRLVAVHHLERVWPELWDEYEEIGARIGGGSLFTVIRGRTHRNEERVIKMLNPNIGFHLDKAKGLFLRSSERLAKQHGGSYRLVPGLIQDVEESIRLEMNFAGFLEKDRAFHEQWNGFTDGTGRYQIKVPRSFGPEQTAFIQEEFVVAKNLTRWDELVAEGHDLKQITRLLSTAYVGQLAQGRALSDIHPGNEAITADNEVVLFDRTLYLDLGEGEQRLLMTLFTSDSEGARSSALEEYFTTSLGMELPIAVRQAIQKASGSTDVRASQEILLALREANLRPPLTFMFILKNLRALDGMAQKAGWKRGMIEAINA